MKQAHEVLPWKVTDISVYPYGPDYWSMNPSIHLDGDGTWRFVARIVDYAMPDGSTIRSPKAGPGHQTKNAMAILDPKTWRPIKIYKMAERDGHARVACANTGFEDMRLFHTDRGGLQGIAASLHLDRGRPNGVATQPPEQVLLSFDSEYNIIGARPIRGEKWNGTPQKNWVPFDRVIEPRFLYSIDRGTMVGANGALSESDAISIPSGGGGAPLRPSPPASPPIDVPPPPVAHPDRRTVLRNTDVGVQAVRGSHAARGRRVAADALSSRPSSSHHRTSVAPGRVVAAGRALPPKYRGLRGGSQLVSVGDDAWLGIAHEMNFTASKKKFYWHVFYLVDGRGKTLSMSDPLKLAENGIEFAAGLAIDGDRAVISFGVDDMECKLGETKLSAVMEILRPVVPLAG